MKIALLVIGIIIAMMAIIGMTIDSIAKGVTAGIPAAPTVTCDPFTDAYGRVLFCNPTFIPVR